MSISHASSLQQPEFIRLEQAVTVCPDADFDIDLENTFVKAKKWAVTEEGGKLFKRESAEAEEAKEQDEEDDEAKMLDELSSFNI